MTQEIKRFRRIVSLLPKKTGVYEIKNEDNETIYVGKAKDIRLRMRQHLLDKQASVRALKMRKHVVKIDFTETQNETEALILENNLIKEKKPKYNILLRDDKTYSFICVSIKEDFPRIFLTRKVLPDGNKYFGPKTSTRSVRQTIDLLNHIFHLRTCKNMGKKECIEYHIKHCDAPCVDKISKNEYGEKIKSALQFLNGQSGKIVKKLKEEMQFFAEDKNFESATIKRDLLKAVENILEKQVATVPLNFSADAIGIIEKFDKTFIHLFQIRQGKIIASEDFVLEKGENLAESLAAFLRNYSAEYDLILPNEILKNKESWEEYLGVKIIFPKIGDKKILIELAEKNAENYARRHAPSFLKRDNSDVLEKLAEKLGLEKPPSRIEAYDISHLSGEATTASMVVCVNGEMKKADYRQFHIQTLGGEIDDFKAMNEVISRRVKYLPKKLPPDFSLRKATKKDLLKITLELSSSPLNSTFFVLRKLCKTPTNPNSDENSESRKTSLKKEYEIAGFVRMEKKLISDLFVYSEFRGKKLSDFLISYAISKSKEKKVYVFSSLVEALECLGFRKIKKEPKINSLGYLKNSKCQKKGQWLMYKKEKKDQSFSSRPNLILIDGGKGQLSSAEKALCDTGISICSLAKKEEEVFTPKGVTSIEKNSSEGLLLQKIRDESHRFAISLNRKTRNKKATHSVLDEIVGIGKITRKKLLKKFGSAQGIRTATDEQIEKLVGKKLLKLLRQGLGE